MFLRKHRDVFPDTGIHSLKADKKEIIRPNRVGKNFKPTCSLVGIRESENSLPVETALGKEQRHRVFHARRRSVYSDTAIRKIIKEWGGQIWSKDGFIPVSLVSIGISFSGAAKLFSSSGSEEESVRQEPSGRTDVVFFKSIRVFHGSFSPLTSLIITSFVCLSYPATA